MTNEFTKEQLGYIEDYSGALEKLGGIFGNFSIDQKTRRENAYHFLRAVKKYQNNVPEEIRKNFKRNSELEENLKHYKKLLS